MISAVDGSDASESNESSLHDLKDSSSVTAREASIIATGGCGEFPDTVSGEEVAKGPKGDIAEPLCCWSAEV